MTYKYTDKCIEGGVGYRVKQYYCYIITSVLLLMEIRVVEKIGECP